jgi:hypothetical protein
VASSPPTFASTGMESHPYRGGDEGGFTPAHLCEGGFLHLHSFGGWANVKPLPSPSQKWGGSLPLQRWVGVELTYRSFLWGGSPPLWPPL